MSSKARKSILVTGATGGVGRELLLLAGEAGWNVVGIFHSNNAVAEEISESWTNNSGTLQMMSCDLTDPHHVSRLLDTLPEEYGPDALVHLAARPLDVQPIHRVDWDDYQFQLEGTLKPVVLLTPPLVKRMLRRGSGRIIAVLSAVVQTNPPRGFSSYAVAKYALSGYLNCLSAEFAGRGIAVNTVSPGAMNTTLLRNLPALLTDQMAAANPGGNWIKTSSVAHAILWLAADAPAELTGSNLSITTASV